MRKPTTTRQPEEEVTQYVPIIAYRNDRNDAKEISSSQSVLTMMLNGICFSLYAGKFVTSDKARSLVSRFVAQIHKVRSLPVARVIEDTTRLRLGNEMQAGTHGCENQQVMFVTRNCYSVPGTVL